MLVDGWPPGAPRILVSDAWLANAGDGAIALATERRLRRLAPGASILHAAYQGDLLAGAYPELHLVPPLAGLLGVTPAIPEMEGWSADDAEAIVEGADGVLSQGGGFLMEHYTPTERLVALAEVVDRGLPLALGAQSIGYFREGRPRELLAQVLGAAVAVGVRESESRAHVLELTADERRILAVGDEAFSLFGDPSLRPGARGVALCLSRHRGAEANGRQAPAPPPDAELVELVKAVLAVTPPGEPVTLLSTQQGLGHLERGLEDDGDLAVAVREGLAPPEAERIEIPRGYVAPLAYAEAIAEHRALVTMRMHPAILALSSGVPPVVLAGAYKTAGVLADATEPWMLTSDPAASSVAGVLRRVLGLDGSYPASGRARLERARAHAARNDTVFECLLEAAGSR